MIDAPGKMAFLMHADGAIHAIINNDDNDIRPDLACRCQFLHGHLETAITGKGDHGPVGKTCSLPLLPREYHPAHRPDIQRQLTERITEMIETVQPGRIIAGTVGHDAFRR